MAETIGVRKVNGVDTEILMVVPPPVPRIVGHGEGLHAGAATVTAVNLVSDGLTTSWRAR